MLRLFIALLCFCSTFTMSLLVVAGPTESPTTAPASTDALLETAETITAASVVPDQDNAIEFSNLDDLHEFAHLEFSENLIDVLETDAIYRESEVIARTGETWLTLFQKGGRYFLAPARTKVAKLNTKTFAGDEGDVKLAFDSNAVPVFATRKLSKLVKGPVETIYHRPSWKEIDRRNLPIDPMKTGFRRKFNLGDNWYTLRVSRGKTKGGTTVGVLVLEQQDGVTQIIAQNFYEPAYGETIGELLWVGDLDRDGKLDLYFDEFNEKGYFGVGLYLSSSADPGELVKLEATFSTAGC